MHSLAQFPVATSRHCSVTHSPHNPKLVGSVCLLGDMCVGWMAPINTHRYAAGGWELPQRRLH